MRNINTTERDNVARKWGKSTLSAAKSEAKSLGIRSYSGSFYRYLRDRYYKNRNNVIGAIGFAMPRHAVFVHKGVGRGYPIDADGRDLFAKPSARQIIGSMRAKGYNNSTIKAALNKTGFGASLKGKSRKPKPWFNPVVDRNINQLADELANADANIIANNLFID